MLDDGVARRCARAFEVPLIGTLAIVVRAKKAGLVNSVAGLVTELRNAGFYIGDVLLSAVLERLDM